MLAYLWHETAETIAVAIDPEDPGTLDLLAGITPAALDAVPAVASSMGAASRDAELAALRAEVDRLTVENAALLGRTRVAEAEAVALRARLARRHPLFPDDGLDDGTGGLLPTPQPRGLADLGNLLFTLRGR